MIIKQFLDKNGEKRKYMEMVYPVTNETVGTQLMWKYNSRRINEKINDACCFVGITHSYSGKN